MHREDGGPDLSAEVRQSLENEHTTSNIPTRRDDSSEHPVNSPSWVQNTRKGKVTPQRGLTTYGRLEKTRKTKERGISEGVEKDVWEFNPLSQDPGIASAVKGNAKKSASILKSSRAKRQDPVGDDEPEVDEIFNEEDEKGWSSKEGRNGCKKAVSRKSITGRRSKTTAVTPVDDGIVGIEPVVYGDDENDDDYNPAGNPRKAKTKVTINPPISSARKKTRSNTDDWELMPALPKGRKSTVLKQLAAGFEFDRDSIALKAAAKTRTSTSASTSPLHNNPPLSPFKVDLARDSLILPEEEKEKYDVFLPTATSPGRDGLLPRSSESSSAKSPQLPSRPQEMIESIAVGAGTYMSSIILDEEYLGLKHKVGKETSKRDVKESESISLSSTTPSTRQMKSKLGSRSKTLAELLDVETDEGEENDGQGVVNMDVPRGSSFQSPTRKRVRLKQARGKTIMAPSPNIKESESSNDLTVPTSPAGLQKEPKKPRVVAASDDDSPLSDLDKWVAMSPKRILDNRPNKIHDQMISQRSNILPEVPESPKSKQPVPKATDRKRSGRNASKIFFPNEDSTHDEDGLPAAEPEAQSKPRKPPAKRRKKSQAESTDANEQSPQPPTLILGDTTSDEERNKKPDSLLPTTATKKAPRTGKVETQHGKGNKKMKNSKGSTKQLDDQGLGEKEGAGDPGPNGHDVGGPSHSQVYASKEQSIGAGKEKTPPSTPVLRETTFTLKQPETPQPAKPVVKRSPHSPINGGKPPPVKFRVGLSRRANIEPLHGYLKK